MEGGIGLVHGDLVGGETDGVQVGLDRIIFLKTEKLTLSSVTYNTFLSEWECFELEQGEPGCSDGKMRG